MIYRCIKRGFDIFNSMLALVVLSPLILAVSIGIKLSSKGPVFYVSERIGQNNNVFRMYKFRSMHIRQEGTVESTYLVNENRVFAFGKFIRKSKIDELPQLINVLRGDMSIVGPRPYGRKYAGKNYTGKYSAITSVKPGLACFDSLYDYTHGELFVTDEKQYASEVVPVKVELAMMYVDKQSIATDVSIIVRTVKTIFEILVLRKTAFKYTRVEQEAISAVKGMHLQ